MPENAKLWLPTWVVVLVAVFVPLLIAFGFLVAFDMANPPISGIEYQSDPSMGQRIASRNDALVFLHAVAQAGFLLFGGIVAPSQRTRMLFLLIAGPISGLALLVTFIGLLAG